MTRMLAQARPVAEIIADSLECDYFNPAASARHAYMAAWPATARSQRSFHVFGGEFLMKQDVEILRGVFMALFKVRFIVTFQIELFRMSILHLGTQPLNLNQQHFFSFPRYLSLPGQHSYLDTRVFHMSMSPKYVFNATSLSIQNGIHVCRIF